jgi:hypothetical protein
VGPVCQPLCPNRQRSDCAPGARLRPPFPPAIPTVTLTVVHRLSCLQEARAGRVELPLFFFRPASTLLPCCHHSLPVSRSSSHLFFNSFRSKFRQGLTVLLPMVLQLELHSSDRYIASRRCRPPITGEFSPLRFPLARCGLMSYVSSCSC